MTVIAPISRSLSDMAVSEKACHRDEFVWLFKRFIWFCLLQPP
jgi:hypothetical protein